MVDNPPAPDSTATVTQTELAELHWAGRLAASAWVARTWRHQRGGGFGDQDRHPYTWTVYVYIDGEAHQIISARGAARAWSNLDRLERWLREQGFRTWWVTNELEPTGAAEEIPPLQSNAPSGIK